MQPTNVSSASTGAQAVWGESSNRSGSVTRSRGVVRRHRLAREDIDSGTGQPLVVERIGEGLLIDDATSGYVINRAEGFIRANSRAPTRPRVRSFKGAWIDTMSDQRSSSSSGMAG